jgi:hypothetical protein
MTATMTDVSLATWLVPWRTHGIALGPASWLIPEDQIAALQAEAVAVQQRRFAKLQADLETRDRPEAKPYLRQWLGRHPFYEPGSVWGQIAATLRPLAAAYLEAPAILRFYNLWETTPTQAPPNRSQLWHRDHEDTRIAKAFLYLSDVTPEAGPLTYASGTHAAGPRADVAPAFFHEEDSGWRRSTDAHMAAVVPEADWIIATGPIGTLVLVDTAGFHKGGYATATRRLLASWEWTTAAACEGARFHRGGRP